MPDIRERAEPQATMLSAVLRRCRGQFVAVGLFSLVVNLLTLSTALYMMQLFDRVLASRSIDTLLYLSLIVGVALALQAVLDGARTVMLGRTSGWLELAVGPEAFTRGLEAQLRGAAYTMDSLRDLGACRVFLGSPAMLALYDLPWVPIYVGVAFLFHPLIGWLAVAGALLLLLSTVANSRLTDGLLRRANRDALVLQRRTDALARNAEVTDTMGMVPAVLRRWRTHVAAIAADQQRAADMMGVLLALTRFLRVAIQVACLGVGAWLALQNEITGGAMVAASIVLGRALAPVEQTIGAWRQLIAARQGYQRLRAHLAQPRLRPGGVKLPAPEGRLTVERMSYAFPGHRVAMIKGVTFALEAGESMAVLGPSAAGKTTLIRLLTGALEPTVGAARLDGADLFHWPREHVGRHIGYLPQDVELFEGTVFDNIARMDAASPDEVFAAAQLAGCHEMILRLPGAYATDIGEAGALLSGGQRQLVGLARALFRQPRYVVLDEPSANLDTEGELALAQALAALKRQRVTTIIVTHRPSLVQTIDKVLVLRDGAVDSFGPRVELMKRLIRPVDLAAQRPAAVTLRDASTLRADTGAS